MTTTPLPEALRRILAESDEREQTIATVRHLIEFRHGDQVLAAFDSDSSPIHTPRVGDDVDLHGTPVTVTAVTVVYDTDTQGRGIVLAVVEITAADRLPVPLIVPAPSS